jgi:hypothetical protein
MEHEIVFVAVAVFEILVGIARISARLFQHQASGKCSFTQSLDNAARLLYFGTNSKIFGINSKV